MFHFGYAVRSEKYVGWLCGTRNIMSMPRSLSLEITPLCNKHINGCAENFNSFHSAYHKTSSQ